MSRRAAAAAVAALAVLGGCSHKGADAAQSSSSVSPSADSTASAQDLMTQPWPSYKAAGPTMQPEVVSSTAPITLPPSKSTSPAGVATGFPRTAEGALAQLKAVDEAGMQGLSVDTARAVYKDSFASGNPDFYQEGWIGPIADRMTGSPADSYTATMTVQQGLIRGTAENGSFAFVCIVGKLQIDTKYSGSQTLPIPDCEAMRWNGTRWMVVPQSSVQAPNVSPHSAEAYRLGFRDLES